MVNSDKSKHSHLMESLKDMHDKITPLIGDRAVHYIDIPIHGNVGDLLILEGTLTFFKKHSIKIKNYITEFSFHDKDINKDDVIVIHGGGNLGDLYPHHQKIKNRYISRYPDNRIIILPQSIHFKSQDNFKRTCELYRGHQDLHICLRDKNSYSIGKNLSDKIYLLPDMAHQLYPLSSSKLIEKNTES